MKMKPIMIPFPPCNDLSTCCPNCKKEIIFPFKIKNNQLVLSNPSNCKNCGQALDWD